MHDGCISSTGEICNHGNSVSSRTGRVVRHLLGVLGRGLTSSEDLLKRLEGLEASGPGERQTMVELGAGVWADAIM
jgi:hypothetical protein